MDDKAKKLVVEAMGAQPRSSHVDMAAYEHFVNIMSGTRRQERTLYNVQLVPAAIHQIKTEVENFPRGLVKAQSKAVFDASIKDRVHAVCTLGDLGEIYFVMEEPNEDDPEGLRRVNLAYYNGRKGESIHSRHPVFITTEQYEKVVAINPTTFLFTSGANNQGFLLIMDEDWTKGIVQTFSHETTQAVREMYTTVSSPKSRLSKIRHGSEGDFSLSSDDGEVVKVHKSVMVGLWPFFKAMMDSEMTEAQSGEMKLPMPHSTLETIVRFMYDEDLELGFDDAARMVVFADMYELPELLEVAVERVKREDMSIKQTVFLWQRCFEAKNDGLRKYASGKLEKMMSKVTAEVYDEEIEGLEKDELSCLFKDVCLGLGEKQRK